ncbi:MAG TPA: heparan-alpha-glucosaminide N-acetyltransferase domain-containing protein [Crenalkalicoccus sp.]|nr:heparan-alpha-glucosaminide N-acetyltransferase domain-containing protein [Crenalkalicoccus sp.]
MRATGSVAPMRRFKSARQAQHCLSARTSGCGSLNFVPASSSTWQPGHPAGDKLTVPARSIRLARSIMTIPLELRGGLVSPDLARAAPALARASAARPRIDSIDLLRGVVMVLMALDHTRDFFGAGGSDLRDVSDPALFLTRWVTHFCAPIFILLAGLSAYLYGARGRGVGEVSRFLVTRGLWLILLEFTVVRLGWTFDLGPGFFVAQVIWAIGASMVVLAGLVHLPMRAIGAVALVMIGGHNLLDGVSAESFGAAGWIWNLLHQPKLFQPGLKTSVLVLYPLLPWVGVMAAGYALGPLFRLDSATRVRRLALVGALATAGFAVIRLTNVYGDPAPWAHQASALATVLSFVDCEKYPPSLLYLLMTVGPGLLLLAAFEKARGRLADWILVFGRVPLFYYVAHIFVIHALAVLSAWAARSGMAWFFGGLPEKPADYGLGLPGVYAVAALVVVALWPLCRRFAALKQRRTGWWWSYL